MFLWRLFFLNPMGAMALCICLATLLWCIAILRKRQKGLDRFLAVCIGAICVTQGMRLLQQTGFISLPGSAFAELMITGLYLIAILILRISAMEHKSTQVRLRLVEADDQTRVAPIVSPMNLDPPEHNVTEKILGSNPLATIALDTAGHVIYWNSAAERLLGWKSDEVVGKPSPLSLNAAIRSKAGSPLRVESWVSALHDSAGRPSGTVHVIAPLPDSQTSPALTRETPALAC